MDPYPTPTESPFTTPMPPSLPDLSTLTTDILRFMPALISALVIFVVSLYLAALIARLAERGMQRRGRSQTATALISRILRWSIVAMGVTSALQTVGFNLTAFLTGLGILGFTLGFALQDVSKNLVAGLLLMVQQPFEIGEEIEVSGFSGPVVDISLRATEMRTYDGRQVLIPNADVYTGVVVNLTRNPLRRIGFTITVDYDNDLALVQKTIVEALSIVPGIEKDPPPNVYFNKFTIVSIEAQIFFWINIKQESIIGMQDRAARSTQLALRAAGVRLPSSLPLPSANGE